VGTPPATAAPRVRARLRPVLTRQTVSQNLIVTVHQPSRYTRGVVYQNPTFSGRRHSSAPPACRFARWQWNVETAVHPRVERQRSSGELPPRWRFTLGYAGFARGNILLRKQTTSIPAVPQPGADGPAVLRRPARHRQNTCLDPRSKPRTSDGRLLVTGPDRRCCAAGLRTDWSFPIVLYLVLIPKTPRRRPTFFSDATNGHHIRVFPSSFPDYKPRGRRIFKRRTQPGANATWDIPMGAAGARVRPPAMLSGWRRLGDWHLPQRAIH